MRQVKINQVRTNAAAKISFEVGDYTRCKWALSVAADGSSMCSAGLLVHSLSLTFHRLPSQFFLS